MWEFWEIIHFFLQPGWGTLQGSVDGSLLSMPSGQAFFSSRVRLSLCVFFFPQSFFKCLGYVVPRTSFTLQFFFLAYLSLSFGITELGLYLPLSASGERRNGVKETHWPFGVGKWNLCDLSLFRSPSLSFSGLVPSSSSPFLSQSFSPVWRLSLQKPFREYLEAQRAKLQHRAGGGQKRPPQS